jgi:hypothetical protein
MTAKGSLPVILLLSIALTACGGNDRTEATSPATVTLDRCTKSDGSGYGWSAEVSGISCDEVGQFIKREVFPRAGQVARKVSLQAGGFVCDVSDLADEPGWRVSCDHADQHFVFDWTP